MGSKRRGARNRRGRDNPAPTQCVRAQCFDPLVRNCVACNLFRTPEPRPAAGASSSLVPGTALQPQESGGAAGGAAEAEAALPLPALLFGAPALLGLALALVLVGLLGCRWRRRLRAAAPPGTPEPHPVETLDHVTILPPGPLDATAPVWPPTREDAANTSPAHSVPVPATELGSTELVTTKTAGPEQQ